MAVAMMGAGFERNGLHALPMPSPVDSKRNHHKEERKEDAADAAKELGINFMAHELIGNYGPALEAMQAFSENVGSQVVQGMNRFATRLSDSLNTNIPEKILKMTPTVDVKSLMTLSLKPSGNSSKESHASSLMDTFVKKRGSSRAKSFEQNTRQTPQLRR